MGVVTLHLEDLKGRDKYQPTGAMGKHYIEIVEILHSCAIVKDKQGVSYSIQEGALYDKGKILTGLEEIRYRLKIHQRWVDNQQYPLLQELSKLESNIILTTQEQERIEYLEKKLKEYRAIKTPTFRNKAFLLNKS